MPKSYASSSDIRILASRLKDLKKGLAYAIEDSVQYWTDEFTEALRKNCPYRELMSSINWSLAYKAGFHLVLWVGTTHPRGARLMWGIEFGRPAMTLRSQRGFPIWVRIPPTREAERKKFEAEKDELGRGKIIRKVVTLGPIAPRPFIIKTLREQLPLLVPMMRERIVQLIEGMRI